MTNQNLLMIFFLKFIYFRSFKTSAQPFPLIPAPAGLLDRNVRLLRKFTPIRIGSGQSSCQRAARYLKKEYSEMRNPCFSPKQNWLKSNFVRIQNYSVLNSAMPMDSSSSWSLVYTILMLFLVKSISIFVKCWKHHTSYSQTVRFWKATL